MALMDGLLAAAVVLVLAAGAEVSKGIDAFREW